MRKFLKALIATGIRHPRLDPHFDSCDKLLTQTHHEAKCRLNQMIQAIRQTFRGELVSQHPGDEPDSARSICSWRNLTERTAASWCSARCKMKSPHSAKSGQNVRSTGLNHVQLSLKIDVTQLLGSIEGESSDDDIDIHQLVS